MEIFAYAKKNDCVIVTHDLDFSAILSVTHGEKPSVIQIRGQALNNNLMSELIAIAYFQHSEELEQGAVLSLDVNNSRLRVLPL